MTAIGADRGRHLILAAGVAALAAIVGFTFQDDPYRLYGLAAPNDQLALAHRDSPYAHITWVVSEAANYAELRFFDKVEGGVCLRPSWADLASFGAGSLSHIAMPADADLTGDPPDREWPESRAKPNPGTVAKSAYVNLFPAGILLNQRLAADTAPAAIRGQVLVVGLGSGVGIAVLAHHFPELSITVVDIDQAVIDMVRGHYPLLKWLEGQTTSDGRPRLVLHARDARQFVRHEHLRRPAAGPYDLIIVDAYTDGSTIPPHLMTREFYADTRRCLAEDGIILSNIIGSYSGAKRRVLGGAIRSQREAGLIHAHNIPIMHSGPAAADYSHTRNNIVLASAVPLDPDRAAAAWSRLNDFVPYPQLPTGRFRSASATLVGNGTFVSSAWDFDLEVEADRALVRKLDRAGQGQYTATAPTRIARLADARLVDEVRQAVLRSDPEAFGWTTPADRLFVVQVDWIEHARRQWRGAIDAGQDRLGRTLRHSGEALVGPLEGADRKTATWTISDAPLFTDAMPNADIFNR